MKPALRYVLAGFFILAGIGHFTQTAFFVEIVPGYLPAPAALVYISGVAEIAGGLGLLLPATRRAAAWGLVVLLVMVFPANLDMALNPRPILSAPPWMALDEPNLVALWLRLPLQAVLVAWAWWYTPPDTDPPDPADTGRAAGV